MAELICVNAQYEEVPCDSPDAAFKVTKAGAKEARKAMGLTDSDSDSDSAPDKPAEEEEEEEEAEVEAEPEEKAIKSAPQNKAVTSGFGGGK